MKIVKATCRPGRGTIDSAAIKDAMTNSWNELEENREEIEENEKNEIKAHFNALDEDVNLGDLLFGDCDDFSAGLASLSNEKKMAFFNELFA